MADFHSVDWKSNSEFQYRRSSVPPLNSCLPVTSSLTPSRLLNGNSVFSVCLSLSACSSSSYFCTLLCPSCYVTNSWSYRNPVCWRWFSPREAFIVIRIAHPAGRPCSTVALFCVWRDVALICNRVTYWHWDVTWYLTLLGEALKTVCSMTPWLG